jgi:uncharacterized protein
MGRFYQVEPPLPSPCISVCQMDAATGWCRGCYRTMDEIVRWGQSDYAYKTVVWQALAVRREQAHFPEALPRQDAPTL